MKPATVLAALLVTAGCAHRPPPAAPAADERAIRTLLDAQVDAWNRGDVRAFMEAYERGDDLTFTSGGVVHRGFQATLARYLSRYPDRRAMGTLRCGTTQLVLLGDGALVLGTWRLDREGGPIGGVFSLVLRRGPAGWRILHDHTSSAPTPPA